MYQIKCSFIRYISCIFAFVLFFLGDVKIFDGTDFFLESNGQKEFQIPLAGRADQVLPLFIHFFLFFLLLSKVMIFFLICKKYTHCHFADNKTFIMLYIEVLALYVGRA